MSLPHAGGGVSSKLSDLVQSTLSSPRRWGCFYRHHCFSEWYAVFPTQVGVFLLEHVEDAIEISLPHAGGGVSVDFSALKVQASSSPRRWGCFRLQPVLVSQVTVFPTQVGVFPTRHLQSVYGWGLPHAGGGVSKSKSSSDDDVTSSPRRWGCFQRVLTSKVSHFVFPTQVGCVSSLIEFHNGDVKSSPRRLDYRVLYRLNL